MSDPTLSGIDYKKSRSFALDYPQIFYSKPDLSDDFDQSELISIIFTVENASSELLMNKLRGASVITWIVPGRENFFAVDYFPRRVTLTDTLFLRILFALRLGFHHHIYSLKIPQHEILSILR